MGFVRSALVYSLKEILLPVWRMMFCILPYSKEIKLYRKKAVTNQLKVLYVDTIYAEKPLTEINTDSRVKAYKKVSTLMTFDYRKLARKYGQSKMNEMLVKTAVKSKPDLIHLGKGEVIYGSTIKEIKTQIDTCVIHYYGDFRWEPQPWVVEIGKCADCTLFWHREIALIEEYKELGIKSVGFAWPGTDPEKFYPRKKGKIYDIVFMGNNYDEKYWGRDNPRRQLIDAIGKKGFDLHIYGNGWEYFSGVPNVHIHPFVEEEEFAKICSAAEITLGVNATNNVRMYTSWRRTFNSMASGAFHLTHYVPGLEEVFENKKHLVWFNSVPEAIELIEYYLAHDKERERITEAGRQEVLAHHTWDIRIAEIIRIYEECKRDKFKRV